MEEAGPSGKGGGRGRDGKGRDGRCQVEGGWEGKGGEVAAG